MLHRSPSAKGTGRVAFCKGDGSLVMEPRCEGPKGSPQHGGSAPRPFSPRREIWCFSTSGQGFSADVWKAERADRSKRTGAVRHASFKRRAAKQRRESRPTSGSAPTDARSRSPAAAATSGHEPRRQGREKVIASWNGAEIRLVARRQSGRLLEGRPTTFKADIGLAPVAARRPPFNL